MPNVIAIPDALAWAATDLEHIGAAVRAATATAAAPTTQVLAAGADEVSAAVAALFSSHAQAYQALSHQTAALHDQFVAALNGAAGAYTTAEAANAVPLQNLQPGLLGLVNAPTEALTGRPLIGNGANGTAAHPNGGAGGLLYGNGGNGFSPTTPGQRGGTGGAAGLIGNGGDGGSGGPSAAGGTGGHGGWLLGNG
ncbi:PE family protein, partial [Mycobacterium kansasii]